MSSGEPETVAEGLEAKSEGAIGKKKKSGIVVAGVDVGSLYTKTVLLDGKKRILSFSIRRSGSIFRTAADESIAEALSKVGANLHDISYIVSTGYGRERVSFANEQITELTCHAEGAKTLFPEARTVVDIGGQDSKVIQIGNNGEILNFIMNDKCAAGTGRFLEVMAVALETDIDSLSKLYFQSKQVIAVSSMCTVFAETEVISLLAEGQEKADIVAGLFRAIARRVAGLIGQIGLKEKVVMSGGVAKSRAMVDALGKTLEVAILVPEEPQIIGAFGAALFAAKRVS